jgi:hypothetical protein
LPKIPQIYLPVSSFCIIFDTFRETYGLHRLEIANEGREIGKLCTTQKVGQNAYFLLEYLKERDSLEDEVVGGKGIEWDGVYWVNLIQDREEWRVIVNTITNLQVFASF